MEKFRVFNVGFYIINGGAESPVADETQFDIKDFGGFSEMMNELISLFNDFCAENNFGSTQISYIEEVEEQNKIYTHDEAMLIVEAFEDVLSQHDICVPSPEDDEREPDNMIGLYGSTYSDLLDTVESSLLSILERHRNGEAVIEGEFSGTI